MQLQIQKNWYHVFNRLSGLFVFLVCLSSIGFVIMHPLVDVVMHGSQIDIIHDSLPDVARRVRWVDPQAANTIDTIQILITRYQSNQNIRSGNLVAHARSGLIYIAQHQLYSGFVTDLAPHQAEISLLVGQNKSKHYIVLLQNTAEKRPNGGFFGSFAFVTLDKGHITQFRIIDSYFPNHFMPSATLPSPDWTQELRDHQPITRIAANKFGFSDMDGQTIISLYNKTFNAPTSRKRIPAQYCDLMCDRQIQGVIFARTDTLVRLMPALQSKLRERQFTNANIDLIRGTAQTNKKEVYIRNAHKRLQENTTTLIKSSLRNINTLFDRASLQIYIPSASIGLSKTLTKYGFTNIYRPDTVYTRDTNVGFNKVDTFVRKYTSVRDKTGKTIYTGLQSDIHSFLSGLAQGIYTIQIDYTIRVPDAYKASMYRLARDYHITMTPREQGILALTGGIEFPDGVARVRSTRSYIYLPPFVDIMDVRGDGFGYIYVDAGRSHGVQYRMQTATNGDTKSILIKIHKK